MITVYNQAGEAVTIDNVDAREYVATGQWSYSKPDEDKKEPTTIAEIKEALESAGIEIPDGVTKKADLQALLG